MTPTTSNRGGAVYDKKVNIGPILTSHGFPQPQGPTVSANGLEYSVLNFRFTPLKPFTANGDPRSSIDLGSVGGTLTSWRGRWLLCEPNCLSNRP
ncbi:hypothetical protein VTH06DRAFT_1740 [Thermothelomyces fergusii]